jgi:hypothetical protein
MTTFVDQLREELVAAAAREQAHTGPRLHLPPLRPLALATAGLALTAILVIAIAGGLSGDRAAVERPVEQPTPAGRDLFGGTLFPGERYRTRVLVPQLSFVVADDNWDVIDATRPDVLALTRVTRGGPGPLGPRPALVFQRISELHDPGVRGVEAARVDAPADLHAWLARHPDLRVSRTQPVTVARVEGIAFDVEVRFDRPVHSDPYCRQRFRLTCTFLGPALSLADGMRLHMIQLPLEPEPLTIFTVATSARRLAALERAAAPVLDSLRIDDIP